MKSDILRCRQLHAWYKIKEMHNKRKPEKPKPTKNLGMCNQQWILTCVRTNTVRLFGVGEGQFLFWDILAEENRKQWLCSAQHWGGHVWCFGALHLQEVWRNWRESIRSTYLREFLKVWSGRRDWTVGFPCLSKRRELSERKRFL